MPSNSKYEFKVPLQETDQAGVMFFAHLFSHAHDAYAWLMESMGFPLHQVIKAGEYHIPIAHAEADYLAPMRHGQPLQIQIEIERLGSSSFTLKYEFGSDDRLYARVSTRHVVIDPGTGSPVSIPDDLRQELLARDDYRRLRPLRLES